MIKTATSSLGLTLALVLASTVARAAPPVSVSVCELIAHPKLYRQKLLEVRGVIESDGADRTVLSERRCRGSIALILSDEALQRPGGARVADAIFHEGYVGTADKTISATVLGVLKWDPTRSLLARDLVAVDIRHHAAAADRQR